GETCSKHKRLCPSRQVREDRGGYFQLMGARLSSFLHFSFTWRLAVFYAALFVALGVQLPFLPLWLAAQGLNAGAIGIALGAFIVGSLGAGLLLDLIAARELIWLIVAALTITAAAAYALAPLPPHEGNPSATHLSSAQGLLRDPALLAAAAAASLIQASHAV